VTRSVLSAAALLVALSCALFGQAVLNSISPTQTTASGPQFTLTLNGSGFTGGIATVNFGAATLNPLTVTATQITTLVGAALIQSPGTVNVSVSVRLINGGLSTSNSLPFTINQQHVITTTSLNAMTVGVAYSQTPTLTAALGTPPYSNWRIAGGALPAALTLGSSGTITGTPTAPGSGSVQINVDDSASVSATKVFNWIVTVPSAPTVSVTGLTDTVSPAQQPTFDVQLSSSYALPITGTITLTFTPDAVNPANDPSIQFLPQGRTLSFTIAAGQTRAFPTSAPVIGTGTVSGRIDLTLSFSAGGQNITPTPSPVRSVTVPRSAPKINSVQVVKVTGGFNVLVTGYSTPRQVTQAAFTFTAVTGANLGTAQVPVTVDSVFTTWFAGTSSTAFGSSFLYTQPFTVQGNVSDIASVSVTLTNATGTSQPVSANF